MGKCEECDMRCAYVAGLPGNPGASYMADYLGLLEDCPRYDAWRQALSELPKVVRFVRHYKLAEELDG